MCSVEDCKCGDVAAPFISGEGFQLVAPVWNEAKEVPHPVAVLSKGLHVTEWLRLGGERRVRRAIVLAAIPSLAGLARLKERLGRLADRRHHSISLLRERSN